MLKRNFNFLTIFMLILLGLVAVAGYQFAQKESKGESAQPTKVNKPKKAALSVEVAQVMRETWPQMIKVSGAVHTWQEAIVSSEVSGLRINQVLVDVGSQVKRGQTLVILASEMINAELNKQKAIVARDQAALDEAKADATRAKSIQDSGALSTQKINGYLIAEKTAQANLALSQAELKRIELIMRQTRILAADHGVISARSANLGQVVTAGSELFRLIRQNRVEWRPDVSPAYLPYLHKGQVVKVTVDTDKQVNGKVRMISPLVNENSRNAMVYVDLPKQSARPGMYLTGMIDIGEQSAMILPQSSVVLRDGVAYVFEVVKENNVHTVIQHKVITGRTQDQFIEVVDGVNQGAQYVLTGGAFLNDGDVVKVIEAP